MYGDKSKFSILYDLLNSNDEPGILHVAAVQAMAELGDQRAIEPLTDVVASHGHDQLAFWAAMGIVKLTGGEIDDLRIVKAITGHHEYADGVEAYLQEKHEALNKIAERGKTQEIRLAAKPTAAAPKGTILDDQEKSFVRHLVVALAIVGISLALSLGAYLWSGRRKKRGGSARTQEDSPSK